MAFIETTYTKKIGGYGTASGYTQCWAYATLKVTTVENKVNWTITMDTPANGSDLIPKIKLELYIDGQTVINSYYSNFGSGFPCKDNSSKSGSVTLKNSIATSIPIKFNIGISQQTCQYTHSYGLIRTYYTYGGAPSLTITNNNNGSVTLSGVLGTAGTNNKMNSAVVYFSTDGKDPDITDKNYSYALSATSGGSYSKTLTINKNCTIKAITYCTYARNETDSGVKTLNAVYRTAVGKGSTVITDNYNNTFTITATKGSNGTNNISGGPTNLKWGYTNAYGNTFVSGTPIKLTVSGIGNTRVVYAASTTTAQYGSGVTATTYKGIRQYIAPTKPGQPVISYSNEKCTVSENWTFNWAASTANNATTSPVKGYRVFLYKNGVTIPIKSAEGKVLSSVNASNVYYYDITTNSITIDPVACGFAEGDSVKLGVTGFTRFGLNNNGSPYGSAEAISAESIVQKSNSIKIKVGNKWRSARVLVKVNNKWQNASAIKVKVGGRWQTAK